MAGGNPLIIEAMDPLNDISMLLGCQPNKLIESVFNLFISKSDIPIYQSVCATRYDAMQRKRISANEVDDYERRGEVLCGDMIVTDNGKNSPPISWTAIIRPSAYR